MMDKEPYNTVGNFKISEGKKSKRRKKGRNLEGIEGMRQNGEFVAIHWYSSWKANH